MNDRMRAIAQGLSARTDGDMDTPTPTDFDQLNRALFTERKQVVAEIERLSNIKRPTVRHKRDLKRAERHLDEVTTQIFQANYGLVRDYVRKFTSNSSRWDSEDFEAAAAEGLMKAISTYDPDKGRFGSWAYKPIQRKVLRAVHDADFKTMTPGDFERRPEIKRAFEKLQAGNDDYTPTYDEVAKEAGVTVDQVRRVLSAPHLDSLHQLVGEDGDTELGELVDAGEASVEARVMTEMTLSSLERNGMEVLDPRERMVLVRRFGLDCEEPQKLASIGQMLGLSREAVRQVESKALAKLAHPLVLHRIVKDRPAATAVA